MENIKRILMVTLAVMVLGTLICLNLSGLLEATWYALIVGGPIILILELNLEAHLNGKHVVVDKTPYNDEITLNELLEPQGHGEPVPGRPEDARLRRPIDPAILRAIEERHGRLRTNAEP